MNAEHRDDSSAFPQAEPAGAEAPRSLKADLIMALRLFSRFPTGTSAHEVPDLNRIAPVLPLASLMVGIGPVVVLIGGTLLGLPSYFAATLAVAAMIIANGAMADDALADAFDGLFGGYTKERRLEILKDSRHGTYGVSALGLYIAARITALGALAAVNPWAAGALWLAANVVGRSLSCWLSLTLPAARTAGLSYATGPLTQKSFAIGMAIAAAIAVALAGPFAGVDGLALAAILSLAIALLWRAVCKKLVEGQTGDLIGALCALGEVAMLTGLIAFA
ncbi:MAG TPA: adenosylcobinamide-GDP ribazoletransferase [Devosia sp.]|nr:adenosylcobinamide-GDP ribazoletransferase [Devosia sp.]